MNVSWGWRPQDTNYKSPHLLARYLADVLSRGGNLLLNVSPTGDGSLPHVQVSLLEQIGAWITSHRDAIIGVRPAPATVDFHGPATTRHDRLDLFLRDRPLKRAVGRGVPMRPF